MQQLRSKRKINDKFMYIFIKFLISHILNTKIQRLLLHAEAS